jgi:hypothetical protein
MKLVAHTATAGNEDEYKQGGVTILPFSDWKGELMD